MLCSCWIKIIVLKFGSDKGVFFRQNSILHVLDVEKALLYSYQKASFLMGHQTNHRTNGMFYLIKLTLIMSQTWQNMKCSLSPSYTVTILAPIHHDSSRFFTDGKIGMRRDGKKRNSSINTMSHDAPTVSARFSYRSTTTHDGSATIHHGGATNAHDASTIR